MAAPFFLAAPGAAGALSSLSGVGSSALSSLMGVGGGSIGGFGGLLGGLGGGLGSMLGNRKRKGGTNKMLTFQKHMASTQYQRAMEDMKTAGLNPMLAAQTGGNAAPTGTAIPQFDNPASSAKEGFEMGKLIEAQLDNIKADTKQKEGIAAAQKGQAYLADKTAEKIWSEVEANMSKVSYNTAYASARRLESLPYDKMRDEWNAMTAYIKTLGPEGAAVARAMSGLKIPMKGKK